MIAYCYLIDSLKKHSAANHYVVPESHCAVGPYHKICPLIEYHISVNNQFPFYHQL